MRIIHVVFGGGVLLAAGGIGMRLAAAGAPATKSVGTISHLSGVATRSADDGKSWQAIKEGAKVNEKDRIKTDAAAKLEAKLEDGSMLRLGPSSELRLDDVKFDKKDSKKKKVKTKLFVGKLWAAVTSLFGSDSSFEVTTTNAVAGVRGTRFSASTGTDGATAVKVYDGKVLVSNKPIYAVAGATKGKRVEVAGPQEISQKNWEELVAGAMKEVRVAANGTMEQKDFEIAKDDEWEKWNQERDQLAGLGEKHDDTAPTPQ
jgi:hypothetical protein